MKTCLCFFISATDFQWIFIHFSATKLICLWLHPFDWIQFSERTQTFWNVFLNLKFSYTFHKISHWTYFLFQINQSYELRCIYKKYCPRNINCASIMASIKIASDALFVFCESFNFSGPWAISRHLGQNYVIHF